MYLYVVQVSVYSSGECVYVHVGHRMETGAEALPVLTPGRCLM